MPLYDYNGSVNTEIGKLYDHDGTANHQIGRVYDYNGSANSLIYSAENELYNGRQITTWNQFQYHSGSATDNGSSLFAQQWGGSANSIVTAVAGWYTGLISMDEWKTLTIKLPSVNVGRGSCDYVVAAVLNNPTTLNWPYNPQSKQPTWLDFNMIQNVSNDDYYFRSSIFAQVYGLAGRANLTNQTWTMDVSGITGNFYIGVYAVIRYVNSRSCNFTMNYACLS